MDQYYSVQPDLIGIFGRIASTVTSAPMRIGAKRVYNTDAARNVTLRKENIFQLRTSIRSRIQDTCRHGVQKGWWLRQEIITFANNRKDEAQRRSSGSSIHPEDCSKNVSKNDAIIRRCVNRRKGIHSDIYVDLRRSCYVAVRNSRLDDLIRGGTYKQPFPLEHLVPIRDQTAILLQPSISEAESLK